MRDFRRADAERIGAKGAVRGGVAVAADDQQPRQRQSLLGADHMHNALARIAQAEQRDAVFRCIGFEVAHHRRDLRVGDRLAAPACRHVMIGNPEGELRLGGRTAARFHLAEGVKRAFVHVVAVDPEQGRGVLAARDLVRGPELVDQGTGLAHGWSIGCVFYPVGLVEGPQ